MSGDPTPSATTVAITRVRAPNGITWGSRICVDCWPLTTTIGVLNLLVGISVFVGAYLFWKNRHLYPLNKRSASLSMFFAILLGLGRVVGFLNHFVVFCWVTEIMSDFLTLWMACALLLTGWHVFFTFSLFKEKTSAMRWDESSSSSSASDDTADDHVHTPRVLTSEQRRSMWYSNHVWLGQPRFFAAVVLLATIVFGILYIILNVIDTSWVDDPNCFPSELTYVPLYLMFIVSLITLVTLVVLYTTRIKDMADGLLMRREMAVSAVVWGVGYAIIFLMNFLVVYSEASSIFFPIVWGLGFWLTLGWQVIRALREKKYINLQQQYSSAELHVVESTAADSARSNNERPPSPTTLDEVDVVNEDDTVASIEESKRASTRDAENSRLTPSPTPASVIKKMKSIVKSFQLDEKMVGHLLDKKTFDGFKLFMDSEFASENLLCWKEMWSLIASKTIKEKQFQSKTLQIYLQFVTTDSPLAVNWTYEVYERFVVMCRGGQANASVDSIVDLLQLSLREVHNNMRESFGRYMMRQARKK